MFRSSDNGDSWSLIDANFLAASFAFNTNGDVFAGTYGGGVIRLVTPPTAVNDNSPELPSVFTLEQNYPNPFNPSTTIQFFVVKRTSVTVKVFDILGREITTLVNDEVLAPGMHKRIFDGDHLPNGIYLYRMQAGEFEQTRKLTLLK